MCTLALAYRVFPGTPIVVAANRDERDDRAAAPPERWAGDRGIVAPRDLEAGGTWIGFNAVGVFAAITNRWTTEDVIGERSRGRLVLDALDTDRTADAIRAVERALLAAEYEGFNLVLADADEAVVLEWDGHLRATTLTPGLHVVTNTVIDEYVLDHGPRAETAERQARAVTHVRSGLDPSEVGSATEWLDRAGPMLGDHDVGACVHGDGYGTHSSTLLALSDDGRAEYRYADGPPCVTPFEPVPLEGAP